MTRDPYPKDFTAQRYSLYILTDDKIKTSSNTDPSPVKMIKKPFSMGVDYLWPLQGSVVLILGRRHFPVNAFVLYFYSVCFGSKTDLQTVFNVFNIIFIACKLQFD